MKKSILITGILLITFNTPFCQSILSLNDLHINKSILFNAESSIYYNLNIGFEKLRGDYDNNGKLTKYDKSREYILVPAFIIFC